MTSQKEISKMFGIVILAVYAVLMIGVTLMFTRKTTDAEGFHVCNRHRL